MNVLSLFAGVGGLELGLERAGMDVVAQVELDEWCRRVLARHWPDVPQHDDVRTAPEWWLSVDRPIVDVVCGGFPCQPFSTAGRRRGIGDERWGWPWMADVVRVARPSYVLLENVAALLADADAFGWVLGDLAALGFDAEWGVLPACAVGAPHRRERLFLVAYPHRVDGGQGLGIGQELGLPRIAWGITEGKRSRTAARAWRDRVDRAVAASRADDREADGDARRMVAAGGNAVVPQVAEHIGRLIVAHHNLTQERAA